MPMPPPNPKPSSSLSASARDFKALKARLEGLAAAMKGNPKFQVKKFEVGAPGKSSGVPAQLTDYASVFDGATLEWELRGVEKTAGKLIIPKVSEIAGTLGKGISDEESWVLIPGLTHASIELSRATDEAAVLDRETNEPKTEGLTVLAAFDAAVDSLGIKGWELRYYDDFGGDDDDELFDKQGEILDAVDRAWAALGLRAP